MKTTLQRLLLTALLAAGMSSAHAQTSMVPNAMSYQGVLTDDQGNPVAPTTPENRNIEFRIYNTAAGGTALWGEAQTVTVFKGNFSVILGNGTALSGVPSGPAAFASVFTNATSADLYFGITPQGGAEFAPRQKLLSSAFALRAKTAETVNASAQPNGQPSNFNWLAAKNFTLDGHGKVNGSNVLEFGFGIPDKVSSGGVIGYQAFSSGLDIVGAGTGTGFERRITLWAEAGTEMKGSLFFGNREGQHLNLYSNTFGIGIQTNTLYQRTLGHFVWHLGGAHTGAERDPGGGTRLATLNSTGFQLEAGRFTGDGSGLTNVPIPSTVNNLTLNGTINKSGHGPFIGSFGEGHAVGSQDWTTYFRTSVGSNSAQGSFAWYRGGSHSGSERNAGGGATLALLDGNGLYVVDNVGIGSGKLNFGSRLGQHINLYNAEYGIGIQNNNLYQRSADKFSWFVGGTHNDASADPGGGAAIVNWDNSRLDFYRRVYIGANPTDGQAPLEVSGASTYQLIRGGAHVTEFWRPNNGGAGYDGRTNFSTNVSIRATSAVVAHNFVATSDLRLKVPHGRSDTGKDLETLGALEITDYTMKDKTLDGGRPHKKLIAQQIEKVYPQAVGTTKGAVPDIFRVATAKKGVIAFDEPADVGLKTGEIIRLLQGERDFIVEVAGVTKAGFTVKESMEEGPLFVYGRKVEDLRVVDYEAIAMLNVSATQELARLNRKQTERITRLEAEKAALEKQVAGLRVAAAAQEERLSSIESMLRDGAAAAFQRTVAKTAK